MTTVTYLIPAQSVAISSSLNEETTHSVICFVPLVTFQIIQTIPELKEVCFITEKYFYFVHVH
jgi:hypothetical protein